MNPEFLLHDPCFDCISLAICQRTRDCKERIEFDKIQNIFSWWAKEWGKEVLKKYERESFLFSCLRGLDDKK
jgi:hypothetical protein